MIKENELRIGNWVLNDAVPNITTSIYVYNPTNGEEHILVRMGKEQGVDIKKLQPIFLTKEILLKCGFGGVGFYENVYQKDNFRLHLDMKNHKALFVYHQENNHLELEIAALHQLQNLYSVLTGKELDVTL